MKQLIHRSMALFMALVVFMTTTSVAMDMHYCGETLVNFSFSQQDISCGMEMKTALPDCKNSMISQKSCCTDKQLVKESQNDLNTSLDQLSLSQQLFVAAFTYTYLDRFSENQLQETIYADYSPPFIRQDVQVLHQSFLI